MQSNVNDGKSRQSSGGIHRQSHSRHRFRWQWLLLFALTALAWAPAAWAQTVDLQVIKVVDESNPAEGDTIRYTITVENLKGTYTGNATGVVVSDILPAGLTFDSINSISGGTTYNSGVWTIGPLDNDDNVQLKIDATVDAGTAGTTITNNAVVTSNETDGVPGNNTGSATITVDTPDILMTKTVSDTTPSVGQTITYTVVARNNGSGSATATGLTVRDVIPLGLTNVVVDTGTDGTYVPGSGLWTIGTLADGQTAELRFTAVVDTGTTGQTITNTASVLLMDQPDEGVFPNSASVDIVVNAPDLAVTKVVDDATPSEGQLITYTIQVVNNGAAVATGVQLTDLWPADLLSPSATTGGDAASTYDTGTGIWTITENILTGKKATLEIDATVGPGTSGDTITNEISVTALNENDPDPTNDTASVDITVNKPDILVTKTVNDTTPDVGDTVTFTVKAKNVGTADARATGLVVTDLLPAGLTYTGHTAPAGTTYTSGTGEWNIGTLLDNVERTLTITATVDPGTSGFTLVNTASVTAIDQPVQGVAADTASATLIVNAPDIQVLKTVSNSPWNENQNLTYTITVKNIGNAPASGVKISDLLPGVMTYVSDTPDVGTYDEVTGVWDIGTLSVNQEEKLLIVAYPNTGTSGTDITNTASLLDLNENDSNLANNSASAAILVATADLYLLKTVNDDTPSEGQQVTFSLKLTNNGAGDATTIVVEDILPPGLLFDPTPPAGSGTGGRRRLYLCPAAQHHRSHL